MTYRRRRAPQAPSERLGNPCIIRRTLWLCLRVLLSVLPLSRSVFVCLPCLSLRLCVFLSDPVILSIWALSISLCQLTVCATVSVCLSLSASCDPQESQRCTPSFALIGRQVGPPIDAVRKEISLFLSSSFLC